MPLFLKPNPNNIIDDALVRVWDPQHKDFLPATGRVVPRAPYWLKRLAEGSVVKFDPEEQQAVLAPKPTGTGGNLETGNAIPFAANAEGKPLAVDELSDEQLGELALQMNMPPFEDSLDRTGMLKAIDDFIEAHGLAEDAEGELEKTAAEGVPNGEATPEAKTDATPPPEDVKDARKTAKAKTATRAA